MDEIEQILSKPLIRRDITSREVEAYTKAHEDDLAPHQPKMRARILDLNRAIIKQMLSQIHKAAWAVVVATREKDTVELRWLRRTKDGSPAEKYTVEATIEEIDLVPDPTNITLKPIVSAEGDGVTPASSSHDAGAQSVQTMSEEE